MSVLLSQLFLALVMLLAAPAFAVTAAGPLRYPDPQGIEALSVAGYYPAALRLALERTAVGDEPVQLVAHSVQGMNRERARRLLAQGQLDVIWSSSTSEREMLYEPVRFNLLKSVNEYRVLLIRRQDRERFAAIRSREQLQALRAGAGEHWSDAQIMRNNGLQVITATRHESLYPMLEAGRFDFLPRSLSELADERAALAGRDLEHEQTLLLQYPQPIYFFVAKGNTQLAERIRLGLERAAADGSLDRLFFSFDSLREAWERVYRPAKGRARRLLKLPNGG